MQRIAGPDAIDSLPVPAVPARTPGFFGGGNPGSGQKATMVTKEWANNIQEEIAAVVEAAEIDLDVAQTTQLLQAIAIFIQRATPQRKIGAFGWSDDGELLPGEYACVANWVEEFDRHPLAMAYFNSPVGQARLVSSLDEYEELHNAIAYTYPDGRVERWNGIGGVTKFYWDKANNRMKMPDLQGMFRGAIDDALDVGGVHLDGERNKTGTVQLGLGGGKLGSLHGTGIVYNMGTMPSAYVAQGDLTGNNNGALGIDISRVAPVAPANKPRAWGALPVVYLGLPTS